MRRLNIKASECKKVQMLFKMWILPLDKSGLRKA